MTDWESDAVLRIDIHRALSNLLKRDADVLVAMYGLDGQPSCTQKELAASYGVSPTMIAYRKGRALQRMKNALRRDWGQPRRGWRIAR